MYTQLLTAALLSSAALAAPPAQKRQATDGAQFTAAADQLVSLYIPSTVLPQLVSIASEAAAAASVTGDAASLVSSALLEKGLPGWLKTAIPSEWSSQIAALESGIDALRGTVGLVPYVVDVTTTDAQGATITNPVTTFVAPAETGVVSYLTTEVVDGVTSVYSTAYNGASSIASVIIGGGSTVVSDVSSGVTSVASEISSGGSSVASEISSGGSSVFSEITSGGSSIVSEATSGLSSVVSEATSGISSLINGASTLVNGPASSTSAAGAPALTAAAGGVLGLVGLMIAL